MSGNGDGGNVNHVPAGDKAYHLILISHTHLKKQCLWNQDRSLLVWMNDSTDTHLVSHFWKWVFVFCLTNPEKILKVLSRKVYIPGQHQRLCLSVFQFDISWSWIGSCSCHICQGNISEAVFWPSPTKHFCASFNFIMKAWTATNSPIGTKPVSGPHPPLPLSNSQFPPPPLCLTHPSQISPSNLSEALYRDVSFTLGDMFSDSHGMDTGASSIGTKTKH